MRGFLGPICAVLALAASSVATQAQLALAPNTPVRACDQVDTILAAADFVLTEPAIPPRFWRDLYGADAAYFRIRYGGLRYEEGRALLDKLSARSRPPERLLDLKLAFARSVDRRAMIAAISPDPASKPPFASLGQSALRALVVEGEIDQLVDGFVQWRRANEDSFDRSTASPNLANAIDDLDDGLKTLLADRMEKAGLWVTASEIAARKSDLADWLALQERKPGGPIAAKDRDLALRRPFIIARTQPLDLDKQPPELQRIERARTWRGITDALYALARRMPEGVLLSTVLNQHGDPRIATDLAASLVADIDAGRLDPLNAPAGVLRAMVEGLDRLIGRAEREKQLRSFKTYGLWTQQDEASAVIDRALARLALAPVVTGAAAEAERPAALTADFPWEVWRRTANIARAGTDISITEDRLIAADLFDAAGRWPEALNVLKAERDWQAAHRRAHALMVSLDRRCGRDLSHPVPFSEPLYRFGAR